MSDAIVDVGTRTGKRFERWLFTPIPLGRVAALRVVIYLFAWYDVFYYSPPVPQRAEVAGAYRPLAVERVLHLPTPTHTLALVVQIAVPCFATLAATGRAPRTLGAITFLLYMDWIVMGDSFGYVAHDRFAFFVALAVLPTVGSARCGDMTPSERAGWAIRCIQLAVVGTYFLSSWAKVRDAGFRWANGAVLTWAFLRRGTPLAHHLLHHPQFLHVSQWAAICAEFVSPVVLFLRGRWVYLGVAAMLSFHLFNEETLRINFFPHVLCILAFLPLEKVGALLLRARQWRPSTRATTAAAT
jgi:hypothetical protein